MAQQIQIRRGTAAAWAASTKVPALGEWCLDTTNMVVKMGNGVDLFSALDNALDLGSIITMDSIGIWYLASEDTADADPGDYYIAKDDINPSAANYFYLSDQSANGVDVSDVLSRLASGALIYISDGAAATGALYEVTGTPVDGTGYWKIPVNNLDGAPVWGEDARLGLTFMYSNNASSIDVPGLSSMPAELIDASDLYQVYDVSAGQNKKITGAEQFTAGANLARLDICLAFDDNTTEGEPGTSAFRLNNTDPSAASELYIKYSVLDGVDISSIIGSLGSGSIFMLVPFDGLDLMIFTVSGSITDNTTWAKIPITVASSGSTTPPATNYYGFRVLYTPGAAAADKAAGIRYKFSASTAETDPGAGYLAYDDTDPSLVGSIVMDDLDADGVDLSDLFTAMDGLNHYLLIKSEADPGDFYLGQVQSVSDNTGYFTIRIDVKSYGLLPTADDVLSVQIIQAEDNDTGIASVSADPSPVFSNNVGLNNKGFYISITAGETLAAGDVVQLDSGTKAKADAEGTTKGALGICQGAATASNPVNVFIAGVFTTTGLTAGAVYFLSAATAGAITATAPTGTGDQIRVIGQAISTTLLLVSISPDYYEHS